MTLAPCMGAVGQRPSDGPGGSGLHPGATRPERFLQSAAIAKRVPCTSGAALLRSAQIRRCVPMCQSRKGILPKGKGKGAGGVSHLEDYQATRTYILQVMREAGLQLENTLRELHERASPVAWAQIEGYLKTSGLKGNQKIVEVLAAIHPGPTGVDLRGDTRLRVEFRSSFSAGVTMAGGEGCVRDISLGGCRMESETALQPGTELELRFFSGPTEAGPIAVELAKVRWVKGQEFGVTFLRLQPQEEERLRHVIAQLLLDSPR